MTITSACSRQGLSISGISGGFFATSFKKAQISAGNFPFNRVTERKSLHPYGANQHISFVTSAEPLPDNNSSIFLTGCDTNGTGWPVMPEAPYPKVMQRLLLKQAEDRVRKISGVIDKGYSHISATHFCYIKRCPCASPAPFGGGGAVFRFS